MSEPKLNPVNTQDHLSEPVREKLQETTISPLRENGEDADDGSLESAQADMAVETRAQARQRARQEAEEQEAEKTSDLKHKTSVKKSNRDQQRDSEHVSGVAGPSSAASAAIHTNGASRRATPPAESADATMKGVSSPTIGKRSREDFQDDTEAPKREVPSVALLAAEPDATISTTTVDANAERAPKRQRSESPSMATNNAGGSSATETAKNTSQIAAKIPPTSGFANTSTTSPFGALAKPATGGFGNTSATSPFGALAGSKSPSGEANTTSQPQTSSSAFAASGFGSLAKQNASPFGSLTKPNGEGSPFASATPASKIGGFGSNTPGGGFGALGESKLGGFGSSTLGGGFGALASTPKLSGFGGGSGALPPITGLSSAPAIPFGAPANKKDDDDEESSASEADEPAEDGEESSQKEKSAANSVKNKQEPVHISNGEENEETMFSTRAKIYAFVTDTDDGKPAWKERGVGVLKVNIDKTSWEEAAGAGASQDTEDENDSEAQTTGAKPRARLVMRADATNRLILNSPIQKGTLFGEKPAPSKTTVMLLGLLQGQAGLQKLQFKLKADQLQEFWEFVKDLQEAAP